MKITKELIKEKTIELYEQLSDYLNDDSNKSLLRYICIGFCGMLFLLGLILMFSSPIWSIILGCVYSPWWFLTFFVTIPFDIGLGMWLSEKLE